MKIVDLTGTIQGQYLWKLCMSRMLSIILQATKIQDTIEKHMLKTWTHAGFVEEMDKMITEGKVRQIEEDELNSWHGPVHYVTVFAVLKPDSVSTKTQIVSNSALKNAISKLSLNDCMWPGPNTLCDLLNCLLFW